MQQVWNVTIRIQILKLQISDVPEWGGVWGSVVVKALRYWSDDPGTDSRWCHWGLFP